MIYGEEFTLKCDASFFREGDWAVNLNDKPCKITKIEKNQVTAKSVTWLGKIFYNWGLI